MEEIEQQIQQSQQQLHSAENQQKHQQNQLQILANNQQNINTSLQQLAGLLAEKEQAQQATLVVFKADVNSVESALQQGEKIASIVQGGLFNNSRQTLPNDKHFSAWLSELDSQVNRYQAMLQQNEQCLATVTELKQQLAVAQTHEHQLSQELITTNQQQSITLTDLQETQQQRFALFAEKDINQVRATIAATRKTLDESIAKYQQYFQQSMQTKQHQYGLLASAEQQLLQVSNECDKLVLLWKKALENSDFATENDFSAALIPLEKQQQIQQLFDTFETEKLRGQTLLEQLQQHLPQLMLEQDEISQAGITDFERDSIAAKLTELSEQLKQAQIKQGQLSQTIKQDQQQREQQQGLFEQIAEQQVNVDDLAHLSGLIGSADGAKFRKFAHRLNFLNSFCCSCQPTCI